MLNREEILLKELELLSLFTGMCDDLGLRYSLSGGTLLGAIRHEGFIPWDDDIDLNMPRPDFIRLLDLASEVLAGSPYRIVGAPFDSPNPVFCKFIDTRVAVNLKYSDAVEHLWLDIFPVDGMPDDDVQVHQLCVRSRLLRKVALAQVADAAEGTTVFRQKVKALGQPLIRNLNLGGKCASRLSALAQRIPYGSTRHVGVIVWGYGFGERVPLSGFEDIVEVEFEGRQFKAMRCWDEYLQGLYGDYMRLPPEKDRKTHDMTAWMVFDSEDS